LAALQWQTAAGAAAVASGYWFTIRQIQVLAGVFLMGQCLYEGNGYFSSILPIF
jgi:hypothetical protein